MSLLHSDLAGIDGEEITIADLLELEGGQDFYDKLENIFPCFYKAIISDSGRYEIYVFKGAEEYVMEFSPFVSNLDEKCQFTYSVGGMGNRMGAYVELSYNEIHSMFIEFKRDNKLGKLGIK